MQSRQNMEVSVSGNDPAIVEVNSDEHHLDVGIKGDAKEVHVEKNSVRLKPEEHANAGLNQKQMLMQMLAANGGRLNMSVNIGVASGVKAGIINTGFGNIILSPAPALPKAGSGQEQPFQPAQAEVLPNTPVKEENPEQAGIMASNPLGGAVGR
jgi:hypothetical protein